jgi:hypothetical protein
MNYDWLIDRGEKVAQKIGDYCAVNDLDKYEKIALMFLNSSFDYLNQEIDLSKEECSECYQIIHRLCSIPGIGAMANVTGSTEKPGFKERQNICTLSYRFMDDPSYYYSLEKLLVNRNIFLYNIKSVQCYQYAYILRYAEVSNDFRFPFKFKIY